MGKIVLQMSQHGRCTSQLACLSYIIRSNLEKRSEKNREVFSPFLLPINISRRMRKPNAIVQDDYFSQTTKLQKEVENEVETIYEQQEDDSNDLEVLFSKAHSRYIEKYLTMPLPYFYASLDCNHGWMLYWLTNSFAIINDTLIPEESELIKKKIKRNIVNGGLGGISGGVHQIGHAASTYLSVLSLLLAEDYSTLEKIRSNLYKWFLQLKNPDGSFRMHENGESDARSVYCVLCVAYLLNILTEELSRDTLKWLNKCQTFEGGFGGLPHTESHGGYSFCAMACYFILLNPKYGAFLTQIEQQIDFQLFIRWAVMRQYQIEGGLSGRTNKLVDVCYSFWIGALYPMISLALGRVDSIFQRSALNAYILKCCQRREGGFKDKPGKSVDFYHTNYALCGLSMANHTYWFNFSENKYQTFASLIDAANTESQIKVTAVCPITGIPLEVKRKCARHFFSFKHA